MFYEWQLFYECAECVYWNETNKKEHMSYYCVWKGGNKNYLIKVGFTLLLSFVLLALSITHSMHYGTLHFISLTCSLYGMPQRLLLAVCHSPSAGTPTSSSGWTINLSASTWLFARLQMLFSLLFDCFASFPAFKPPSSTHVEGNIFLFTSAFPYRFLL